MGSKVFDFDNVEVSIAGIPLVSFDPSTDPAPPREMEPPCWFCADLFRGTARPVGLPWPAPLTKAYTYHCNTCGRDYESTPQGRWRQVVELLVARPDGQSDA